MPELQRNKMKLVNRRFQIDFAYRDKNVEKAGTEGEV
jgi:hypothetical protein